MIDPGVWEEQNYFRAPLTHQDTPRVKSSNSVALPLINLPLIILSLLITLRLIALNLIKTDHPTSHVTLPLITYLRCWQISSRGSEGSDKWTEEMQTL